MEIISILILILIILIIISALIAIGLSRLSKLPLKFPHLFYSYDKETIALNDQLKTKIKSLKFQFLNAGNKESQLTKMHAKLRKTNNPNLNIFASDTQKIIDENFDDLNESDMEFRLNDSLKSTSLSFAFSSSTSCSDFTKTNTLVNKKNSKLIDKNINLINYNTTAINLDNISIPNSIPATYNTDDNSTIGNVSSFSLNSKN